jgi:ABC-2 type transport system permease protein
VTDGVPPRVTDGVPPRVTDGGPPRMTDGEPPRVTGLRTAFTVAAKDLRQRIRDRSAFVIAVAAPIVLAVIISAALGSAFDEDFHATYAVADEDGGTFAELLVARVLGTDEVRAVARIRAVPSAAAARQLVDEGDVDAAFVVPSGFSDDVASGRAAEIAVVAGGDPIADGIAESVAAGFVARVNEVRLVMAVAADAGAPPPDLDALAAAEPLGEIHMASPEGDELDPASYFGPAMALFFLYFAVGLGVRSILAEREQGTLARLIASPVPARSVLLGKAMAAFSLGLVSVLVVLAVSAALLGASWGDTTAVVVLVAVMALAATAIVWLIASIARTEQQAAAYSALAGVGLSLLGGNFFPISEAPATLRRLALFTPNGQALRGFADLAVDSSPGLATVAPHIAVIAAFAGGVGVVALLLSRRMVTT